MSDESGLLLNTIPVSGDLLCTNAAPFKEDQAMFNAVVELDGKVQAIILATAVLQSLKLCLYTDHAATVSVARVVPARVLGRKSDHEWLFGMVRHLASCSLYERVCFPVPRGPRVETCCNANFS